MWCRKLWHVTWKTMIWSEYLCVCVCVCVCVLPICFIHSFLFLPLAICSLRLSWQNLSLRTLIHWETGWKTNTTIPICCSSNLTWCSWCSWNMWACMPCTGGFRCYTLLSCTIIHVVGSASPVGSHKIGTLCIQRAARDLFSSKICCFLWSVTCVSSHFFVLFSLKLNYHHFFLYTELYSVVCLVWSSPGWCLWNMTILLSHGTNFNSHFWNSFWV